MYDSAAAAEGTLLARARSEASAIRDRREMLTVAHLIQCGWIGNREISVVAGIGDPGRLSDTPGIIEAGYSCALYCRTGATLITEPVKTERRNDEDWCSA